MNELFLDFNENDQLIDICLIDEKNIYFYQHDLIQRYEFKIISKEFVKDKTLKVLKKRSFKINQDFFDYLLINFNLYHFSLTRIQLINLFPEIDQYLI